MATKITKSFGWTVGRGPWVQVRIPRVPLIGGGYWKRVYLFGRRKGH